MQKSGRGLVAILAARAIDDRRERGSVGCSYDNSDSLLHLREGDRQQVGILPGLPAGRVHGGVSTLFVIEIPMLLIL